MTVIRSFEFAHALMPVRKPERSAKFAGSQRVVVVAVDGVIGQVKWLVAQACVICGRLNRIADQGWAGQMVNPPRHLTAYNSKCPKPAPKDKKALIVRKAMSSLLWNLTTNGSHRKWRST